MNAAPASPPPFAELCAATHYSFLHGASSPAAMVATAMALGMTGIGIADRNSVAGVVRAHAALRSACEDAAEEGIALPDFKLVVGSRLVFADDTPDIIAYPLNRRGWGRLTRLLSTGNLRTEKGQCLLYEADLLEWTSKDWALIILPEASALGRGTVSQSEAAADGGGVPPPHPPRSDSFGEGDHQRQADGGGVISPPLKERESGGGEHPPDQIASRETQSSCPQPNPSPEGEGLYLQLQSRTPHLWLAAPMPRSGCDHRRLAERQALSQATGIPLLATNDPLFATPAQRPLRDILTCIAEKTTIAKAGRLLDANAERHLKSPAEMARLFAACPEAIEETQKLLALISFSLDELSYHYPDEPVPQGWTPQAWLAHLAWDAAARQHPGGIPEDLRAKISDELALIAKLRYAPYFLTVYDIVKYARSLGILCQGRGSAANSAVCFLLGITSVDPTKHDLLFSRFISEERREPPDIDVDFEHERREEVIQYIYARYGRHRAGIAATVVHYRSRSAIREVGKALGLSEDLTGRLSSTVWGSYSSKAPDSRFAETGLDPDNPEIVRLGDLVRDILEFPRHLSQHVGGFVLTQDRLDETVPIHHAAMDDRTFIEWDKNDIDTLGLMKVDILGLGMLTCIRKAFELMEEVNILPEAPVLRKEVKAGHSILPVRSMGRGTISQSTAAADGGGSSAKRDPPRSVSFGEGDHQLQADGGGGILPSPSGEGPGVGDVDTKLCEGYAPPQTPPLKGRGLKWSLATVPREDPATYDMLCAGDSVGVFQVESRAQMNMLPRLRPREFYDLVIQVAIVRPGPIEGDMVHPYLRRRSGDEAVVLPSPKPPHDPHELHGVLGKTFGVPLFQEQAMKLAIVAADFSPADANKLRRAMATFRNVGTIHHFQEKMIDGMVARGYERDFAERCYKQIQGFGSYGFPESHAQSFAILVYISSWIKCHHPAVFAAALLNSQPMGFYAPAQIVRDARDHDVEVRAIDINHSDWDNGLEEILPEARALGREGEPDPIILPMHSMGRGTISQSEAAADGGGDGGATAAARRPLHHPADGPPPQSWRFGEDIMVHPAATGSPANPVRPDDHSPNGRFVRPHPHALRLGFRQIDGFRESWAEQIVTARPFASIEELAHRARLPARALRLLADADAFRSLGLDRRQALWEVRRTQSDVLPLFAAADARELAPEEDARLPAMTRGEHVVTDYQSIRLSLKGHPMEFLRDELAAMGVLSCAELATAKNGSFARTAGVVLIRQRPGKGNAIFITLEDETGVANLLLWASRFEAMRRPVMAARLMIASGEVQRSREGVTHLMVSRVEDHTHMLDRIAARETTPIAMARADEVNRPVYRNEDREAARHEAKRQALRPRPEYPRRGHPRNVRILPRSRDFH